MKKISMVLALGAVGSLFVLGWVSLAEIEAADPRFPLPAPTKAGMTPAGSSNCITCHTSLEDLQALAEEPEESESLSEGEG